MKHFIIMLVSFFTYSCVYDPPLKGYAITIENQTDNFVFVTDILPDAGRLRLYDTFQVNNKRYIETKGNYIPQFSKWSYFIPKNNIVNSKYSDKKIDLYFVNDSNRNKNYYEIRKNKLFKRFEINLEEVRKNSINTIFFYNDSIILMHKFSLEKFDK